MAFHFPGLLGKQLSRFHKKFIQLGLSSRPLGDDAARRGGVAAATQSGGIDITEFIKYFD
jgi:hypothetical protein